jgi:hypothetical protein
MMASKRVCLREHRQIGAVGTSDHAIPGVL